MKAFRRDRWRRRSGALGVLAVLALAALAPIHHVHALQRDFAGLLHAGHASDVAGPTTGAGHSHHAPADQPAMPPLHCPVCTLGKMASVLLPPSLPVLAIPMVAVETPVPVATAPALPSRSEPAARPRAPPVLA